MTTTHTAPAPRPPGHRDEIDWAKGFAILCVLLIHARPLVGWPVHDYVIDRAVPMFLTLFGLTSEYWWQRHGDPLPRGALRRWLGGRLRRLMPPVWVVVAVYWCLVLASPSAHLATPLSVAASVAGLVPSMGTFWFVTLILQWILLFPAVRWCVVALGALPCVALSLAINYATHWYCLDVMEIVEPVIRPVGQPHEFYHFWIFPTQYVFLVVCGIAVGRMPGAWRPAARGFALLALAAGVYVHATLVTNFGFTCSREGFLRLVDVPLTLSLLSLLALLRPWSARLRWLRWCGLSSWGLYLGQLLVHESLHLFGIVPEQAALPIRWLYFVALLAGALLLVAVGSAVRRRLPLEVLR